MIQLRRIGLGLGAALLLAATLPAAESVSARDGRGDRQLQPDRSRGFYGFPDWDSKSGGYDRSRREDPRDADKKSDDKRGGRSSGDGTRFPFGPPGFGQPGRGDGPGAGPGPGGFPGFGRPGAQQPDRAREQPKAEDRRTPPGGSAGRGPSQDGIRRLVESYLREMGDRRGAREQPKPSTARPSEQQPPTGAGNWRGSTPPGGRSADRSPPSFRNEMRGGRGAQSFRDAPRGGPSFRPEPRGGHRQPSARGNDRGGRGQPSFRGMSRGGFGGPSAHGDHRGGRSQPSFRGGQRGGPSFGGNRGGHGHCPQHGRASHSGGRGGRSGPAFGHQGGRGQSHRAPAWSFMGRRDQRGHGLGFRGAPSGRPGMRPHQHGGGRGSFSPPQFSHFGGGHGPSMPGRSHGFGGGRDDRFDHRGWGGDHRPSFGPQRGGPGRSW